MIPRAIRVAAVLLLASPAFAQPVIREELLLGDWCAGDGPAFHEEFSLAVEDGVRTFRSWLHHRPAGSGTWELAGRTLTVHGSSGDVQVYELRTVTHERLVLRAEDGSTEVYQREDCAEFGEPPAAEEETAPEAPELAGEWRGRSLCTDRRRAPACSDEDVIYRFTRAAGGAPGSVRLEADKIVAGEAISMYELDFAWSPDARAWTSEVESAGFHGRWRLTLSGDRLSGTLVERPSGAVLREVSAVREKR